MKLFKLSCFAVLAAIFCFGIPPAPAQPEAASSGNGDFRFLREAAHNSAWKITLGNIALKQAASTDVKLYSERIIAEHSRFREKLTVLAGKNGVTLTDSMDNVQRNTIAFFNQEYGAAFDRNYASLMADENQRDVTLYRNEAAGGKIADIRAFASGALNKLEEFVRAAEKILLDLPKPVLK